MIGKRGATDYFLCILLIFAAARLIQWINWQKTNQQLLLIGKNAKYSLVSASKMRQFDAFLCHIRLSLAFGLLVTHNKQIEEIDVVSENL